MPIGVRANIHLGGGRPSFARMDSVGGGVVAGIFRDPYYVGGGGRRNFAGSIFCGIPEFFQFFPLSPVTDPKIVFFKHYCVLPE